MFAGGPSSTCFHSAPTYRRQRSSDLNDKITDIIDPRSERTHGCLKRDVHGYSGSEFASVNRMPPRFECPVCARTFARRGGLNQHVKHLHDKNPRYKCESCGKGFSVRSDYCDHMAVHAGIKRNVCIVCNKRFTYTAALKAHASRCHPKLK